jgi:hypothetical protein
MFAAKRLARERHRALSLLASCPNGCTEGLLLAHGFTAELIGELINSGIATKQIQRVGRGPTPIEISRVHITEAGRRAL